MNKDAMKRALGKIKSARDCHPNAVDTLLFEAEEILEAALAAPVIGNPITADGLKEPKNGEQWHVVWWNESCRMMLPSTAKLARFVAYKNGTLQFTVKENA